MIPLFKVAMSHTAPNAVKKTLMSGYIGEGERVAEFEKLCARMIGNPRVLAVSSGTAALTLALKLAGIGPDSKVVSTPMTCLATNLAILELGADIIWADIDHRTGNISPKSVTEILEHDFVDAVMCVHWAGYPCELDALRIVCRKHEVPLIEDAAHAWGSKYYGNPIGQYCDYACFSFQAIKHLTTGDGGLLVLGTDEDYEKARLMRWFGLDRFKGASMRCVQDPPVLGLKYHMNDIAASIGIANFTRAAANIVRTRHNAERIIGALRDMRSVRPLHYSKHHQCSYWLFPVLAEDQKGFISYMQENGIACEEVHARNDDKTLFQKYRAKLPGVDYFTGHQVNIPCGWWLSEDDLNHIIATLRSYEDGYGNPTTEQIENHAADRMYSPADNCVKCDS